MLPLPDLLRDLRHDEVREKLSPTRWRLGMKLHAWLATHPTLYHTFTGLGVSLLSILARRRGRLSHFPGAAGWTSERDLPAPQGRSFMHQYAALQREAAAREKRGEEPAPVRKKPKAKAEVKTKARAKTKTKAKTKTRAKAKVERREPTMGADWPPHPQGKKPRPGEPDER